VLSWETTAQAASQRGASLSVDGYAGRTPGIVADEQFGSDLGSDGECTESAHRSMLGSADLMCWRKSALVVGLDGALHPRGHAWILGAIPGHLRMLGCRWSGIALVSASRLAESHASGLLLERFTGMSILPRSPCGPSTHPHKSFFHDKGAMARASTMKDL
jgi:hypothetical protein